MNKDISHNIKLAREYLNLSIKDLSERTELSKQSISAYETGKIFPSDRALFLISEQTNFPLSFFYENSSTNSENYLSYRKLKNVPQSLLKKTQRISQLYPRIIDIIQNYLVLPHLSIEKENIDPLYLDSSDIEAIALNLREKWGLGLKPITNVTELLETRGVFISSIDMGDKIDAFSYWDNNKPLILLSKDKLSMKAVRLRFDLCHELFHLMYHHKINRNDIFENEELHKTLEKQANIFASAFLLPEESFLKDINFNHINFYTLAGIKKKWGVSIQAMIQRLYMLEKITSNQRVYLITQIKDRKNELYDDQIKPENPVLLNNAFKAILSNGITKEEIADTLNLNLEHIIEIASLDKGIFSDKENNILEQFEFKNNSLSEKSFKGGG